jgi:hypothetical protein
MDMKMPAVADFFCGINFPAVQAIHCSTTVTNNAQETGLIQENYC